MKKIVATLATLAMVFAIAVPAFAESTTITFSGKTEDDYTYDITIPASLNPVKDENAGTVTLEGNWASSVLAVLSSDETITLTNNLDISQTIDLDVTFEGIELFGDNNGTEVSASEDISVEVLENSDKLFGTWSGVINYSIEFLKNRLACSAKDSAENPLKCTASILTGDDDALYWNDAVEDGLFADDEHSCVAFVDLNAIGLPEEDECQFTVNISFISEPDNSVDVWVFTADGWDGLGSRDVDSEGNVTLPIFFFGVFAICTGCQG